MEERIVSGFGFIAGGWPLDQGKSTVVFIHGSAATGHFWKAQVEGLAGRVNTVALDLPGRGRSAKGGRDTIADYSRAVVEFVDGLCVPKAILCGLSMGGAITQQLLIESDGRFEAGILIGTGARLKVLPAIFEAIENDYPAFAEMLSKYAASEKTDAQTTQLFKKDLMACPPDVAYGDFQACNQFDVMERLDEISVPVLVISAEDDIMTPPKYAQFLEDSIPNTTRKHIMDAGHIAPMEKPQEVNQAIIAFLDSQGL